MDFDSELFEEHTKVRGQANLKKAIEFAQQGDLIRARPYIIRAHRQLGFANDEVRSLLTNICLPLGDIQTVRETFKRSAIYEFNRNNLDKALSLAEIAINAARVFYGVYDIPPQDEIVEKILSVAQNHPLYKKLKKARSKRKSFLEKSKKFHLGYLMEGFDWTQAPIKHYMSLVKYHDFQTFDITFYSRWRPDDPVQNSDKYSDTIEYFENYGCRVVVAPKLPSHFDRIIWLAEKISDEKIDILVSYVMYTVPFVFFLEALKPAPCFIKEGLQQPEWIDLPEAIIHYRKRNVLNDVGRCFYLDMHFEKPTLPKPYSRKDFGIPNDEKKA